MKSILFLISFITSFLFCQAQVLDDFSDGDFSENPAWLGNDSLFIINENHQLQLNAETGGFAWLSTDYNKTETLEWRFWIKEKFSPSSNNFCDIYLICDNQELEKINRAYVLRFGESGSNDVVELLQLCNGETKSICRGVSCL